MKITIKTNTDTLSGREERILYTIVENYIRTGSEAGSATIARNSHINMSSATVRNVMSDLEGKGYIKKPHTSAGRLPTLTGFRYYINSLLKNIMPPVEERIFIRKMIVPFRNEPRLMFREIPKILSIISNYACLLLAPPVDNTSLKQIELIKLRDERLLAILISESGDISHIPMTIKNSITQKELNSAASYFNKRFRGMSINEARKLLINELEQEKLLVDSLIQSDIENAENEKNARMDSIYMEGQNKMLFQPEFSDIEKVRRFLGILDEKFILIQLFDKIMKSGHLNIMLGAESGVDGFQDCALVAKPYNTADRPIGAVAVVGPLRMDYSRAVPLVEFTSNLISELMV
ncbi:MAG TPA: heat-inducible transcriptional repressor HrcA [bacterium]